MWRGDKRILFQVFSIQKITDMLSWNYNLSLYAKLTTVLNRLVSVTFGFSRLLFQTKTLANSVNVN